MPNAVYLALALTNPSWVTAEYLLSSNTENIEPDHLYLIPLHVSKTSCWTSHWNYRPNEYGSTLGSSSLEGQNSA